MRHSRSLMLAAALVALASGPAGAADNWTVRDALGASQTFRALDIGGGIKAQIFVPGSAAGTPYSNANPLAIGGTVGLSGTLPAFATPPVVAQGAAGVSPWLVTITGLAPLPSGAATAANQNVTAAGTTATSAQAVQGVAGGVAVAADTVVRSTATDRGGTLTAGGTAQQFMPANASRRGILLQNQSSGDLYLNCTATATADYHSMKVAAGTFYESSPVHVGAGACSIVGSTTGQAFFAREF